MHSSCAPQRGARTFARFGGALEVSVSFNVREWATEYLDAEVKALGADAPEWLEEVARGEGRWHRRVLEAAEQEAGRHIPAGEALTIAEVARSMRGAA